MISPRLTAFREDARDVDAGALVEDEQGLANMVVVRPRAMSARPALREESGQGDGKGRTVAAGWSAQARVVEGDHARLLTTRLQRSTRARRFFRTSRGVPSTGWSAGSTLG